jgi:hypothetical protein
MPNGVPSAAAAQRDLFEFFSAPLPETTAPLLVIDAGSVAPDLSVVTEGDASVHQEGHSQDQSMQDEPSGADAPSGDQLRFGEAKPPGDEIAAEDSADSETDGFAKGSLDETTKANLRRLEATLTWLQEEAGRLPRAAPLPAVAGLPAVEPTANRATTDRTPQRAPTLPIWLQEHSAVLEPPPPREPGVFWPRALRFAAACAVAAPLSYYFAVATSPLHKRVAEGVGTALMEAPIASPPLPTPRPSDGQLALRAGTTGGDATAEEGTVQPAAEPPPLPRSPPTQVAVMTRSPAPSETPVAQPPSAPSEATQSEPPAPEEAAPARAETAPPAVAVSEERAPDRGAPAAQETSGVAPKTADVRDTKLLVDRGKQFFDVGDLVAARILFQRAANAGNASAAVAMGATYDPVVLAERGVRGVAADLDKARSWYEKAKDMGSPEGPRRLEMLANR